MKIALRILVGVAGLIAIVFGILQMKRGFNEISGKPPTQEVGDLVTLPAHFCALKVPKDWEQREAPSGGTMFTGKKGSGVVANLIVLSQDHPGTVRQFAEENVNAVKAATPAIQVISDAPFPTDSGAQAIKVAFKNKMKDLEVVQSMYFFDGLQGRKILVTTTTVPSQIGTFGGLFDACMKTLTPAAPAAK